MPFFEERKKHEAIRASRARKHKKVKKIPYRFPSVNQMYPVNPRSRGKYLSDEGRIYKDHIYKSLGKIDVGDMFIAEYYEVSYIFFMTYDMMFTEDHELRDVDVSNFLKATEDALFEYLMESDCRVIGIHGYKRVTLDECPKLFILISSSALEDDIDHQGRIFSVSDEKLIETT